MSNNMSKFMSNNNNNKQETLPLPVLRRHRMTFPPDSPGVVQQTKCQKIYNSPETSPEKENIDPKNISTKEGCLQAEGMTTITTTTITTTQTQRFPLAEAQKNCPAGCQFKPIAPARSTFDIRTRKRPNDDTM